MGVLMGLRGEAESRARDAGEGETELKGRGSSHRRPPPGRVPWPSVRASFAAAAAGQPCGRPAGGAGAGLSSGGSLAPTARITRARKCSFSLPAPLRPATPPLGRTAAAATQMEWKMAIGRH